MSRTMNSEFNPVDLTAQARLMLLAASGEEGANEVARILEIPVDGESIRRRSLPGVLTERVLYDATLACIRSVDCKNVLELSCGYSPMGWRLSREGYRYVGADRTLLAETMKLAAEDKDLADCRYAAIDYRNEASLFAAADQLDGPITLITQGLTSDMTMDEKLLAIEGILKVLSAHGGVWFMPDMDARRLTSGFRTIIRGNSKKESGHAKWKLALDSLGWQDSRTSIPALNSLGFKAESWPLTVEPELLTLFPELSPKQKEAANALTAEVSMGRITAEAAPVREGQVKFYTELDGTELVIYAMGRIDSATAPLLLEQFQTAEAEGGYIDITMDFSRLDYLSSAGLRALLVMKKSLGSNTLRIKGANSVLREIFESTGFDEMMEVCD